MKKYMVTAGRSIRLLGGLLGAALLLNTYGVHAAGTASFTMSPLSGTYKTGDTINIVLSENSGSTEINVVHVELSYDAAKLEYKSTSAASSPFDFSAEQSGGSGKVVLTRGVSAGGKVTGTQTIASVSFLVLASTGNGSISLGSASEINSFADASNVWNGAAISTNYVFQASSTTGGNNGGSSGGSKPASGETTNKPSGSSGAPKQTTVTPTTTVPDAQPVAVAAPELNQGDKKYLVSISVENELGKKLSGVTVKLGDKTAVTNKLGEAEFINITAGKYTLTAKGTKKDIVVEEGNTATVQTFSITVKELNAIIKFILRWGWIPLLLAVLTAVFVVLKRRAKMKLYNEHHIAPEMTQYTSNNVRENKSDDTQDPPTIITPSDPANRT